jgi:hypothetical protein
MCLLLVTAEIGFRSYRTPRIYNRVEKGGHLAAWEQPLLFSEQVRAGFRSHRPGVLFTCVARGFSLALAALKGRATTGM